ncbi:MAG TPA: UDP-3-O-(3-hydroxymyristoyl)glucosamine N-acyltransferase [Blastocatellia bacterium]|nr:UDP-3-O-(3-hydroxymyristoyl)glucosamine N-acyltransferase [Blastocatellia bacterium]
MYRLGELARLIKVDLIGNPDVVIERARPFELASTQDVTYALDPSFRDRIVRSDAAAFIVAAPAGLQNKNLLVTPNPKLAFARALALLHKEPARIPAVSPDFVAGTGTTVGNEVVIHQRVTVGRDSIIGNGATLYPGVSIGDRCRIGDESVINSNVSIYDDVEVGKRVIIHSGTVIGADGFGFVADEQGRQVKVLHLGGVKIGDDCEIGANCAVDRGTFGPTILGEGVKLDNLIQVGHNCEVGDHTVIAALTGLSGGTRIGKHCVIAGQVGTNQHVVIGDRSIVTGQAGVTKDVRPGSLVGGTIPAQDLSLWKKRQALYGRLPELAERLKRLEKSVYGILADTDGKDNPAT